MTFHILESSSSQLTNIFQRGRYTTRLVWDVLRQSAISSGELQFFDAHPKEMHSTHLASVQSRNDLSNFVIRSLIF